MEENPLVDFSPAFEDYKRHMTGLRDRYGYPAKISLLNNQVGGPFIADKVSFVCLYF